MVPPHCVSSAEFFSTNLTSENIVLSHGFHKIEFFNLLVEYLEMLHPLVLVDSILVVKGFQTNSTFKHSVKQNS